MIPKRRSSLLCTISALEWAVSHAAAPGDSLGGEKDRGITVSDSASYYASQAVRTQEHSERFLAVTADWQADDDHRQFEELSRPQEKSAWRKGSSFKNTSPYRVARRRAKNKAARKSRKRNRLAK